METLPIEINMDPMANIFDDDSIVNYFLSGDLAESNNNYNNQQPILIDTCGFNNNNSINVCEQQQQQQQQGYSHHQQQHGYYETTSAPITTSHSSPIDYSSSSSHPSSPSVVPNNSSPFDSSAIGSPEHNGINNNNNNFNQQQQSNNINGGGVIDGGYINMYGGVDTTLSFIDPTAVPTSPNESPIDIEEKLRSIFERKPIGSPSSQQSIAIPTSTSSTPNSTTVDMYDDDDSSSSSSEEKDKRNKNNKRPNDRVQNLVHPLTRDELLKISGKEAIRLENQPTKGLEEERQVKKQRRLIKNRESAQLSRMRKKIYIEDLEKKISDLTSENTNLRDEVLYLQGIIKQFATTNPSLLNQNIDTHPAPRHHEQQYVRNKNVKAAGVCLLIIIFSIGIFLNPQTTQSQPNFALTSPRGSRELATLENGGAHHGITRPNLLTLPTNNQQPIIQDVSQSGNIYIASMDDESTGVLVGNVAKKREHESTTQNNKKRIRIQDDTEDDDIVIRTDSLVDVSNPLANHRLVAELADSQQQPQQHSSYIVCSDAPRIISHNLTQTTESIFNSNPSNPLSIGLLIPSDSIGLNATGDERTILEISCLVSSIRVWNPSVATQSSLQSATSDPVDIHNHNPLVIHSP